MEAAQSSGASDQFIVEYMNHTLATAEALGLDFSEFYTLPDDTSSSVYESYKRLCVPGDVSQSPTELRKRAGKRGECVAGSEHAVKRTGETRQLTVSYM